MGMDPRADGWVFPGGQVGTGGWATATKVDVLAARTLGQLWWQLGQAGPHPSAIPCARPQAPSRHLSEASRTLSTSTQDLGPR